MSQRTELRNAYTRNFTKYIEERYVMINKSLMSMNNQDTLISDINEELWYAIQQLNMRIDDRILPFVKVMRVVRDKEDKLRVVVSDLEPDPLGAVADVMTKPLIDGTSHLIDFRSVAPYRRLIVSDQYTACNAKLLIDPDMLGMAIIDVFLDIAMFHSYSDLEAMSLQEKRQFSQQKLQYFRDNCLNSYYELYTTKKQDPSYFSLAFCCRNDLDSFDYDSYIWHWNRFLDSCGYSKTANNLPPYEMLARYHVDAANLGKNIFQKEYWIEHPSEALLVLRTNSRPHNELREQWLCEYFGIPSYHVGAVKVVRLSELHNTLLEREIRELNVSAFKVINSNNK